MVREISFHRILWCVTLGVSVLTAIPARAANPPCQQTVTARVVALDTVLFSNRLGAQQPGGMIFALAGDVESISTPAQTDWTQWQPGDVQLKGYKRPRPLVLRVNQGQCLQVQFRNLLSLTAGPSAPPTRAASVHVQGIEWARQPQDDGSWVGANLNAGPASLVQPGNAVVTYSLYAPEEGPFLLYSTGDDYTSQSSATGTSGDGGQLTQGLFGALMVQPPGAEYYRSQVNHEDLCLATVGHTMSGTTCVPPAGDKLPEVNYQAVYPAGHALAGRTILAMEQKGELVHSDLTALITGPLQCDSYGKCTGGRFPDTLAATPTFHDVAVTPDRLEPYREFVIIYHELLRATQAFNDLYTAEQLNKAFESVGDNFAINYGMGGIGSEILANRLKVGPMAGCVDCKYEEFFLSSWPNGDPAMIVDKPADTGCAGTTVNNYPSYKCPPPSDATRATKAYYPDDPSNVYHGYLWDHTKMRILHAGVDLHHLHHLHAHQWLHSPNSSNGHYLDSQAIGPGSAFTLETVYNGAGNKNLTVGDSIFHCHFYPHFAAGMWALWRVHDTFETGTELSGYPGGQPLANSRALPDGEIKTGTATPAVVPLPTRPLAPLPAPVRLAANGSEVQVCTDSTFSDCVTNLDASGDPKKFKNPGYPFFIPGIGGSRAPHPPLDFALACSTTGEPCDTLGAVCGTGGKCETLDGGLPRHVVQATLDPAKAQTHAPGLNPLDYSKEILTATAYGLPEGGTLIEQTAMAFHAEKFHPTVTSGGDAAQFRTNGQKPISGAPYADPCIDINGDLPPGLGHREYWGVDIQTDATFNKEGWHYPQQRFISLWGNAFDFLGLKGGKPKAPEPFFIRANANDCVKYVLGNLIPNVYELDDFQVRTPTDILGQHIHLVKFDVTSSDGAGNGFNYEDGTFGPNEVVERINAFNNGTFRPTFEATTTEPLTPKPIKFFGADAECASLKAGDPVPDKCKCQVVDDPKAGEPGHFKTSVRGGRWCGAQATVQRWYVDPTLNDAGEDLTFRTVFTHDHFGPSTNQQTGLFAALVSEPQQSAWKNNETGSPLGTGVVMQNGVTLKDGGPTSWQAVIQTANTKDSYREFLFGFQDSALIYRPFPAAVKNFKPAGCPAGQVCGFCSTDHTVTCVTDASSPLYYRDICGKPVSLPNTAGDPSSLEPSCNFLPGIPAKDNLFYAEISAGNIWGVTKTSSNYPTLAKIGWDTLPISPPSNGLFVQGSQTTPSQPEIITFNGASTNFSVNYRNEPVFQRFNSTSTASPADPHVQDPSYVYASLGRKLPDAVPSPYDDLTPGVQPGDPFTPLLRAYQGDDVQVRIVVGAHQNPHNFTLHGNRWLFEPSNVNSGWRSTQTMGISEHFEYLFKLAPLLTQPNAKTAAKPWTDYLYKPTSARIGQMSGSWGLLRAYSQKTDGLYPLPQNPPSPGPAAVPVCPQKLLSAECGTADGNGHVLRCFDLIATSVADIKYSNNTLIYNTTLGFKTPNALLYLQRKDYDLVKLGKPAPGYDPATGTATPLVLRAAAGDCLKVKVTNKLKAATMPAESYLSGQLPVTGLAGANPANRDLFAPSKISQSVGLRPQLVTENTAQSDGDNVGFNPSQTAAPNQSVTYYWYAGNLDVKAANPYIPVEFGASNLIPSDPVNHHEYGLFGALIIEPERSTWVEDPNSRAQATVTREDKSVFRDFALVIQDDIFMQRSNGNRKGNVGAVNLRTEPFNQSNYRTCPTVNGHADVSCVLANTASCNGSPCGAPQTPVLCAQKGQEMHFHLLHPGGALTNHVFEIHGHVFAEEPYTTPKGPGCAAPVTQTNVYASQTLHVGNECPDGNVQTGPTLSEWKNVRSGHGPTNHFDIVIPQAGGTAQVTGDYLYRTYPAIHFATGIWGVLHVTDGAPASDPTTCPSFAPLTQ